MWLLILIGLLLAALLLASNSQWILFLLRKREIETIYWHLVCSRMTVGNRRKMWDSKEETDVILLNKKWWKHPDHILCNNAWVLLLKWRKLEQELPAKNE